jgi:nucleotide-binding universal stress UspA family protein
MGAYRDILVAYDGSKGAIAALDHAVGLARDQNARLTILSVARPLPGAAALAPAQPAVEDPRVTVERELAEAVARLPQDVGVTTIVAYGTPATCIVQRAREGNHDLIVLGSRGHGRVHDALMGCVSRTVLHASPVPVLVLPVPACVPAASALEAPAPTPRVVEPSSTLIAGT